MQRNQHGLSRTIPTSIKRDVRIACGFGCVICGATIYEYEHFEPDFKNALSHEAEGIALLCPSHHAEVTKGVIPKSVVKHARKKPIALRDGFSKRLLPYFGKEVVFLFGGGVMVNTPVPIIIGGEALFNIVFPRSDNEPVSISAKVRDAAGKTILAVHENEWRVSTTTADFEWVGSRYIFRDSNKDNILVFNFSIKNTIVCEYIKTSVRGKLLQANAEKIIYDNIIINMKGATVSDCMVGFCFN